ncbi:hypothetical protein [Metabacillus sp. 84]|uniref:hypothetical protein n=1 Tax=Metabacillus sp. 84 TaxID=3404705 RepID=UPI003CF8E508
MKKYWKTAILAILAIAGISSFYAQSAYTISLLPDFKIIPESGSTDEEMVVLAGYTNVISGEPDYETQENLKITNEGTIYVKELNIFERQDVRWIPEFERIQQNYKDFMRGYSDDNIYEDNQWLAKAAILSNGEDRTHRFEIGVLDKKTKKEMAFKADVPNDEKEWMTIEDVQRVNNEIKILAQSMNKSQDLILYTFSIKSRELVNKKRVSGTPDQSMRMRTLGQVNVTQPNSGVVYQKISTKEIENSGEGIGEEIISEDYYFSDYQTGKEVKIKLPVPAGDIQFSLFGGSYLYMMSSAGENFSVLRYNMNTQKTDRETEIPVNSKNAVQAIQFKQNTVYFSLNKVVPAIKGYDLKTGKEVYSSKISSDRHESNKKLEIHSIQFLK